MITALKATLVGFLVFLSIAPLHLQAQQDDIFIIMTKPEIGESFENQSDVTLSGTATPNSIIVLSTEQGEYATLTSKEDGTWSYTIPTVTGGSTKIQARVDVKIDELSSKSAFAATTFFVKSPASTSTSVAKLAQTGAVTAFLILAGLLLLTLTMWTLIDYHRHKRPLKEANKKINYSFWHHLKVVSIPLLRYRLSVNVYKRTPSKSERVRRY